ncbi:MAG: hypothetical protein RL514_277 [Verrucomicrobiota bacterium]|jgi:hypothetical protein
MFTSLFKKNPPVEIAALRRAVAQSAKDAEWRAAFHQKAEALAADVRTARTRLQNEPSDATAAALVAAMAAETTQAPGLREAFTSLVSWQTSSELVRLKETLAPALEAAIDLWTREESALAAEDATRAEKLGVPAAELSGGLSTKIKARVEAAQNALHEVENDQRLAHHAAWLLQGFNA